MVCQLPAARWALRLALLAALPFAAPAFAQPDPVAITRALIERHDLDGELDDLREWIDARRARARLSGRPARLFDAAMDAPATFAEPLAAFNARVLPRAPRDASATDWQQRLRMMVRAEWPRQFAADAAQDSAAADCPAHPPAPPQDLDQATEQIETLAAEVDALLARSLRRRDRALLLRGFLLLQGYALEADYPNRRERRRLRRFLDRLAAADPAPMLCAAARWAGLGDAAWLARLRELLAAHPGADGGIIARTQTAFGDITFGGRADSLLRSRSVLFHADLGGDDFYGVERAADFSAPAQFIVDFAGNDTFSSTAAGGYASGVGSVALLVDMAGDDTYRAATLGQAGAAFGVAALVDLGGDDRYDAEGLAQGAALHGVALLYDAAGSDQYRVRAMGQGVGMTHGLGVLADASGDDAYRALGGPPTNYGTPGLTDAWSQGMARGVRGMAPGGIGVLADGGGADRYDAGSFSQGGGYYFAVGVMLDRGAGGDVLLGSRYNAGWGAHGGVGYFRNEAGSDRYRTRHAVSGGLAWDYSLALFLDDAGDDIYQFREFSLAASAHGAIAWFVDGGGSDRYPAIAPALRYEEQPNIGVFVDRGGDEESPRPACRRGSRQGFVLWLEDGGDALGELPDCP